MANRVARAAARLLCVCNRCPVRDERERDLAGRRGRKRAIYFVGATSLLFLCGGPLALFGMVFVVCSTPPPLGPMRDRLPQGVEVVDEANWCGDPPGTGHENAIIWKNCVRVIVLARPGTATGQLLREVGAAFRGFGYNSVDHGFGIRAEHEVWPDRPERGGVVVAQFRDC